jgi:type I restriction enzyme M protein
MSSNQSGEGEIRRAIIEADLVDCMVALPGQLFYSTQIPVCLWFLSKNKSRRVIERAEGLPECMRDRKAETLFIDARKIGTLIDRVHREFSDADISKIADTFHAWKLDSETLLKEADKHGVVLELAPAYADVPGFSKSATTDEIAKHGYVLTPGRYVGAEEAGDEGEPFEEKMTRLVGELNTQFDESTKLERSIKGNLAGLGYGG